MKPIFYHEIVTSRKTSALFIALTFLFLSLFLWRALTLRFDWFAIVFFIFFCFFLFYVANYRKLEIALDPEKITLKFGLFRCRVAYQNIADVRRDHIPTFLRLGGAGIHFMVVYGRYRMSMNFLEHPRIVIGFKNKIGPVRDLSFSTRSPDTLVELISVALPGNLAD